MSTGSTALPTFAPRIEPTIPRDVQRHLQLIYQTLNNHTSAFQALPKATSNSTTATNKTFFPRISPSIPHDVQNHLQLIYGALNNHTVAFGKLPKVAATPETAATLQQQATTKSLFPRVETTISPLVQLHLQLIYGKLDNHAQAFAFYKQHMPTS
jgi:hypothetical protein